MDAKVMIQELAKALATQNSIDKKVAQDFVQTFFQVIIRSLKQDKYVKIKGLGTFKQIEVESRESMNIHTGERFEIQGHMKISFIPDTALKDAVNKPFAHFETVALNDEVTDQELEAVDQEFDEQKETAFEEQIPVESPVESAEEASEEMAGITPETPPIETIGETRTETIATVESDKEESITETEIPIEPLESTPSVEPISESESEEKEKILNTEDTQTEETPSGDVSSSVADLADSSSQSSPKKEQYTGNQDEMEEVYDEEEEEEYERKRRKYYVIFTTILVAAALAAGYGIGYLMESSKKPHEVQILVYDTVYVEKKDPAADSLQTDEPIIKKDETTPPLNGPEKTEEKAAGVKSNESSAKAKPTVTKAAVTAPAAMTSATKSPATKTTATKPAADNHSQYPQLSGGAYWITGTAQTYKLSKGETIRIIAERFFGSRQMELYIEKYNNISDPDHVAEGTVLNIPKLQKK